VKGWDIEENEFDIEIDGYASAVVQHEMDHLNGILFIDYMPKKQQKKFFKKHGEDQRP
jgi:peptide deformylase